MTQPPPDGLDSRLAEVLGGQYDLVRLLGAGGMGRVWLARDRTLERDVAIKVVAEELSSSPQFRERFLREARTVARLRHDGIVSVYAAGDAGGVLYFVMEFVRGESLRELLQREKRLDAEQAVPLLIDLAQALDAAHRQGIVHRDVKPENILISETTGRAMLTDFGVAQAAESGGDGRMTATGMVMGSPRYMSPEQAVGERDLDGRSDIYSLGLVAYELLSGGDAFEATSAGALLAKRLTTQPAPLATAVEGLSLPVASVVMRALEREPGDRWESGAAFAVALDAALAGRDPDEAVAALGDASPVRLATAGSRAATARQPASQSPVSRLRGWRGVTLLVAAVALLAAGFAAWQATRPDAPTRQAILVLPFEVIGGDSQLDWLREGSVSMLTLDLAHWEDLTVIDYGRTLDLLQAAGLANAPRVSADDARRMASEAQANSFVRGRVQRIGDSLMVTAGIYNANDTSPYAEFTEYAAASQDPRHLFDMVARDLLQISGAPPITPSLAATTTPSLNAYREYLAGLTLLNGWQLDSADAAFRRAIARDSGFALAHYKLALTAGWRSDGDLGLGSARLAVANAGRLPPRERALVEAFLSLTDGLSRTMQGNLTEGAELLGSARQQYRRIIARDSQYAEAWYGLGDAHFHLAGVGREGMIPSFSAALRAFDRTLALDSSFHLAYQHKLQIYQQAAMDGRPFLLVGDSLVATSSVSDPNEVARARQRAAGLAIREARHWVALDPDAGVAHSTLASAYAAAGDFASAVEATRTALARGSVASPEMYYDIAAYELGNGRWQEADTALREARRAAPFDTLQARRSGTPFLAVASAANVAMHGGRIREALTLAEEANDLLPGQSSDGAGALRDVFGRGIVALGGSLAGVPFDLARPLVDSVLESISHTPGTGAGETGGVVILAILASGDTSYARYFTEQFRAQVETYPAYQAWKALHVGDTARAYELSRQFALDGSTPAGRAPAAIAIEAEVLAAVGDLDGALATYRAMRPATFGIRNIEAGWALYARTLVHRADIHAALGDTTSAIPLYEQFIARWENADPELQPQVQAARVRLRELRDAARSLPAGPG